MRACMCVCALFGVYSNATRPLATVMPRIRQGNNQKFKRTCGVSCIATYMCVCECMCIVVCKAALAFVCTFVKHLVIHPRQVRQLCSYAWHCCCCCGKFSARFSKCHFNWTSKGACATQLLLAAFLPYLRVWFLTFLSLCVCVCIYTKLCTCCGWRRWLRLPAVTSSCTTHLLLLTRPYQRCCDCWFRLSLHSISPPHCSLTRIFNSSLDMPDYGLFQAESHLVDCWWIYVWICWFGEWLH